ncbi:ferric reductase-like transmembrane domain-containing protein [Nisaea sediminum]|uniref:ferric reductase-like transmembrane domain-containing protein n=1 Tax=Nisaea sediminum TaxID=2775867 RepID=UPI00186656A3|nr:ferric reductase-like transmembrane domain-containing protein [Nisaea sediminum]
MGPARKILIWGALALAIAVPVALAAASPLLAWRGPVYIAAGFAGIAAMVLLLLQPLLVGGYLPGLAGLNGRRVHRAIGAVLVAAVVLHVAGLWITSPPDMVDALFFRAPTPFSAWGVIGMWTILTAALLAVFRDRLKLRSRTWRRMHSGLAVVTVLCSVIHALLIVGTMETLTKAMLCILVSLATAKALADLKVWTNRPRRRG